MSALFVSSAMRWLLEAEGYERKWNAETGSWIYVAPEEGAELLVEMEPVPTSTGKRLGRRYEEIIRSFRDGTGRH